MKLNRLLFSIAILISITSGTWWISVILGFIATVIYVPYFEVLIFGAILDALVLPYRYDFFIGACIILAMSYFLRKKIAIYDKYV